MRATIRKWLSWFRHRRTTLPTVDSRSSVLIFLLSIVLSRHTVVTVQCVPFERRENVNKLRHNASHVSVVSAVRIHVRIRLSPRQWRRPRHKWFYSGFIFYFKLSFNESRPIILSLAKRQISRHVVLFYLVFVAYIKKKRNRIKRTKARINSVETCLIWWCSDFYSELNPNFSVEL